MLRAKLKGATGEREVIKLLQPMVEKIFKDRGLPCPLIERNALQFARGGYDIIGVDWCAIEVKRCETLQLTGWWRQAIAQAGKREPILFYRQNHGSWRVRVLARLGMWRKGEHDVENFVYHGTCDLSFEEFMPWFGLRTNYWAFSLGEDWLPAREAECQTKLEMTKARRLSEPKPMDNRQKMAAGLIPTPVAGTIPPPWA